MTIRPDPTTPRTPDDVNCGSGLIDPFPPLAVCWPTLSEQEAQDTFEALDDWVDWLIDRYGLDHRVVPPCWAEHPALLEELSALRTGWLTAYCLTAPGDAPLTWHGNFAYARQRLADWAARTGCRTDDHRGVSAISQRPPSS